MIFIIVSELTDVANFHPKVGALREMEVESAVLRSREEELCQLKSKVLTSSKYSTLFCG